MCTGHPGKQFNFLTYLPDRQEPFICYTRNEYIPQRTQLDNVSLSYYIKLPRAVSIVSTSCEHRSHAPTPVSRLPDPSKRVTQEDRPGSST